MQNAGLDEAQAGIKIAKRNINKLRYAEDTTHMAESEEELKSIKRSRSVVSDSFAIPLTIAYQASLSMRFPRQEYWSG